MLQRVGYRKRLGNQGSIVVTRMITRLNQNVESERKIRISSSGCGVCLMVRSATRGEAGEEAGEAWASSGRSLFLALLQLLGVKDAVQKTPPLPVPPSL